MKIKSALSFLLVFVLMSFLTQACSGGLPDQSGSGGEFSVDVPVYRKAKEIKIQQSDLEQLKIDLFGYEQTLFANTMNVRVTDEFASDVYAEIEQDLIDEGWRYQSSFLYDMWQKGDHVMFLYFEDNLTSEMLNNYRRSYGIEGLEPGQTMIFTFTADMASPMPNPTMTKAVEMWSMTETADAMQRTQRAIEADQERTQQAQEYAQEQTQQSVNETQQALAQTQQSYDFATQTAIAEQQKAESIKATATAIAPILEQMGTEFEGEDSLPAAMYVAREDPTRWDLNSNPGWLHVRARYTSFNDENTIPKNVFVYPLDMTNISIVTRVDGNMSRDGQNVGIGLTPNTYQTNGYTIKFGIQMDEDSGRGVYAWGCFSDECGYWGYEGVFDEQIGFSGPVFLRLDVEELKYSFYFSENGVDWIYLGEIEGYAAGDNLMLNAGGGDSWYDEEEFDAYYDFIRFSSIVND
jgi:hypothetical protein